MNTSHLDSSVVTEHGLRFRCVPAGPFLMGSSDGDPDEQPVHEVHVAQFWLSETTISWFDYARLMGWSLPPASFPPDSERGGLAKQALFFLAEANKIRLQYCEDRTGRARAWHAHDPTLVIRTMGKAGVPATDLFGKPKRSDDSEYSYTQKPLIAVSWQEADELCAKLSTPSVHYRLPTEAEWEKAARGGLVGRRYAWGDEPPTPERCDFNRLDEFAIKPFRSLPPNGYGLYGMCGSVWEWTNDAYDALSYSKALLSSRPIQPLEDHSDWTKPDPVEPERVLRGGSWSDGADAVTVSFRMSRRSVSWRAGTWSPNLAPNIGFRICRIVT